MYTKFLLPPRFKLIGWILAIPSFILMLYVLHGDFSFSFLDYAVAGHPKLIMDNEFLFNIQTNNFTDELVSLLLITGLLFIAFSKEKDEDEMIASIRLDALLWAVFFNSVFIMCSIILFYNSLFLNIITYNLCTPLILFIARFNLVLKKNAHKINPHAQ
jgi:hypothetical protein